VTEHDHSETYKQLSLNIAYYRRKTDLTQAQLSEKAGISLSYLAALESPKRVKRFNSDTLFDIARALDIELSRLFDFSK